MSSLVLVVDDNPVNLKLASEVLEASGFVVQRANNAAEALNLLDEAVPDVVLMDIALPGIDGITLTRRLKCEERYRDMPIVALTAYAMKGDASKFLDAGCDGYISKPIDTRAFADQVRSFMRRREAGR